MPSNKQNKRDRAEVESSDDSMISMSRNDLHDMITSAVNEAVKSAVNDAIEKKIGDIQGLKENIDIITSEMDRISTMVSEMKSALKEKDIVIADLGKTVSTLKSENVNLKCQLNDFENYQRKENLRIIGIPESKTEVSKTVVTEFFQKRDFKVKEADIHIAHRVGKKDGTRPRAMIVRLFDRNKRDSVIKERRKLKGSGITIAEDVSAMTMKTLMRVQRSDGIDNAWIWNGKIFARHRSNPSVSFVVKPFQSVEDAKG